MEHGIQAMNLYLYLKHFPLCRRQLTGGPEKAVHGLASGLAACGDQVTVLCEGSENSLMQSEEGYNIHCFATDQSLPAFTVSKHLKHYIAHRMKQSLVILNGNFHPSVFAISRLLRKHQLPYIVAPHDPYHPSIFRKKAHLKWPYWYLIERRLLRQAKAVQVLDIRHGDWLRRLKVSTPVIEIPNGFAPDEVPAEPSLRWSKEGVATVLYLGRLDSHHKGLDLLIDALAQLTNTCAVRLVMQGPDWGDRGGLEARVAQLQLSDRVSFLNADYDRSAPEIIVNYDIFCLPSRFDGFGLSALEAMLAGRVLLVSEFSGIAPHVQASGCGVVVRPEVPSIQQGLRELLQRRSKWKDMGIAGRRYALTHLQWKTLACRARGYYQNFAAVGTC
jgi:glycosyltransferase involved in cell wall biosynthesis